VRRIHRVLFATDFSTASVNAFNTALSLTKGNGGTLTILHVRTPFMPIAPDQYLAIQTWREIDLESREWTKRELAKLVTKAEKAGIRTTGLMAEGQPAGQIVRTARSKRADLLVVGTHGRTGFTRLLLGSVAMRVVATASCPVVTVRGR
jgi:nucleotide-binding universal stress UspA family protein